jgi:hypothetical protein
MKYRGVLSAIARPSVSLDQVGDSPHFQIEKVQSLAEFPQPSVNGRLGVCRHTCLDESTEELGNSS